MKKRKKEVKSNHLKKFEKKFKLIEKSQDYLEKELSQIKRSKEKLREKIRKERLAISFINKAKRLRSSKKKR